MPAPTVESKSPAKAFVEAAAASRLIDRETLMRLYASGPPSATTTAERFAAHLVERGDLTQFQADKILGGATSGLCVGPYRILCPIARGGMGIVYLARSVHPPKPGANRLVALKILAPKRAKHEPRTLIRFLREMELGRALPLNAHLVQTYDSGIAEGVHFLALEYVPGVNAKQLADQGTLTVERAARVFADVASGLHAAHQAGIVHRDVKPANIMVMPSGRGKLLDFGLAMKQGEIPHDDPSILGGKGYTLGTMDYLAPEQGADALAVTPAADLYALGCSLYYALGGTVPFPAGSAREKIKLHQTAAPRPLQELNPTVPVDFVNIVDWMMAKNPKDRPPSGSAVAESLEKWAAKAKPLATLKPSEDWDRATIRDVEKRWQAFRDDGGDGDYSDELRATGGNAVAERPKGDYRDIQRRRKRLVLLLTLGIGILLLGTALALVLLLGKKPR
jgi:serine/threonine protein kinase